MIGHSFYIIAGTLSKRVTFRQSFIKIPPVVSIERMCRETFKTLDILSKERIFLQTHFKLTHIVSRKEVSSKRDLLNRKESSSNFRQNKGVFSKARASRQIVKKTDAVSKETKFHQIFVKTTNILSTQGIFRQTFVKTWDIS